MDETAETAPAPDRCAAAAATRAVDPSLTACGGRKLKALVRPLVVEVPHLPVEDARKLAGFLNPTG